MLSISKRGDAGSAENYLVGVDSDYYMEGESNINAFNYGNSMEHLDIEESFSDDFFSDMLRGNFNGQQLGRPDGKGGIEHTPGWDLTFSAPKSISILALEGGDKRLIEAHHEAVKSALNYLQENHAFTRITKGGDTSYVKTDNLMFSVFTHTTSRELDPQLHSHSFMQNVTYDDDGKARSVESEPIFKAKMTAGLIYRSELARLSQEIGYSIEVTNHDKSFFEIEGIPKEVILAKSKRRSQIQEALDKYGITSQRQTEVAAIMTRSRKRNMSGPELMQDWSKENNLLGFNPSEHISRPDIEKSLSDIDAVQSEYSSPSEPQALSNSELKKDAVLDDVRLAYRSIAVNEAVFTREQLLETSTKLTFGKASVLEINDAIFELQKLDELVPRAVNEQEGFTTSAAINTETDIIRLVAERMGDYTPIASSEHVKKLITNFDRDREFPLNEGQSNSVISVFSDSSGVSAIDGWAGVGKTTTLSAVDYIAKNTGMTVKGIAPTGSAAETLYRETEIESKTLASFLYQANSPKAATNEIWLLDESSLGNADELHQLISLSNKTGSRMILLGDKKQHHSVEWGRIFQQLQEAGIPTAHMHDIFRQTDPVYRDAVIASAEGRISDSFEKIQDSFHTGGLSSLINDINEMSLEDINKSMFVIPSNKERIEFSSSMRSRLQELNALENQERSTFILRPAQLNRVSQSDARFYEKDLIIEFQNDKLGFTKGSLWQVTGIPPKGSKSNQLELTSITNPSNNVTFDLSFLSGENKSRFDISVFSMEKRQISVGDKMIWKKSNKDMQLLNGDKGKVTGINSDNTYTVEFTKQDNSILSFNFPLEDKTTPLTIDWDYAQTSFVAQGQQKPVVRGLLESWRRNLVNQQSFYVTISRGREFAKIYTDNVKKLQKAVSKRTGINSAAIDRVGDVKEILNDHLESKSLRNTLDILPPSKIAAMNAVKHSIIVLTDKTGIFSHSELINHSFKHGFGEFSAQEVTESIHSLQATKSLSFLSKNEHGRENYYTSGIQISKEGKLAKLLQEGIGKRVSISGKGYNDAFIKSHNARTLDNGKGSIITESDAEAISSALSSKNEVTVWEGSHEHARTLASGLFKTIANSKNKSIRALSFNTATRDLHNEAAFNKTNNIYGFISFTKDRIAQGQKMSFRNEVWYVEGGSQMSVEMATDLTLLARMTGAKIVIAHDTTENPIQGGRAIDVIKNQDITSINIDATGEQTHSLKTSNLLLRNHQLEQALDVLNEHIIEIPGKDKQANDMRVHALVETYTHLEQSERKETNVVIHDSRTRDIFNSLVRDKLTEQGEIVGPSSEIITRRSEFLSPAEKQDARYYTLGHNIIFSSDKISPNSTEVLIKAGENYRVLDSDLSNNKLRLQSPDGKVIEWSPKDSTFSRQNNHDVFKQHRLSLSKGDKVRLGETYRTPDGKNILGRSGDVATVHGIGDKITLKLLNGKAIHLETSRTHKLDYAYSGSQYTLKGKESKNTLALVDSSKPFAATKSNLINILSNTRSSLSLIVDSKSSVMKKIKDQPDPPKSALAAKKIKAATNSKSYVDSFGIALSRTEKAKDKLNSIAQKMIERLANLRQSQQQAVKSQQQTHQQQLQR